MSKARREAFQEWFLTATERRWISPSSSRVSSSLLFVPKKDGALRVCIDFRRLNEISKPRIYAPRSDRALRHHIATYTWWSKIDIKDAFFHLSLAKESRPLTAFRTPFGLFQWNVLPQGLNIAPAEFQLYIEHVLQPLLGDHLAIHIDDILISSNSRQHCARLTDQAKRILDSYNLEINWKKSAFITQDVTFCGFRYRPGQCIPVTDTQTLAHWPTPTTPTELRAFLGLTNSIRDHIPHYAALAVPLYQLTGKQSTWSKRHTSAFLSLRAAATRAIPTHTHDTAAPATLTTDASLFAAGAILRQHGRVTAIWSRSFTQPERNYTANERELLAVVDSLKAWSHLLERAPMIRVETDNMINATNIKADGRNRRINRWIEVLQQFNLKWVHVPGVSNLADTVSRRPDYK
jgi:ribonuclease HI